MGTFGRRWSRRCWLYVGRQNTLDQGLPPLVAETRYACVLGAGLGQEGAGRVANWGVERFFPGALLNVLEEQQHAHHNHAQPDEKNCQLRSVVAHWDTPAWLRFVFSVTDALLGGNMLLVPGTFGLWGRRP